jgi:Fe-S oxidoreductase
MFPAFAEVPAYPLVFPIFWGAMAFFALTLGRRIRVMSAVTADGPSGARDTTLRLWGLIRYTILQTRMFRERRVGVMHYAFFVGSTTLLIGNSNFVTGGLFQAVLSWPFDGLLWPWFVGLQNVTALMVFAALPYATFRRLVTRPSRLTLGRIGLQTLLFIFLVVSTEFLAQCFESARYGDIAGAFAANAIATVLRPLGEDATRTAFVALWWGHILVLSSFLVWIPSNKHFHVYTSFVNVWFRKLAPRGRLPKLDLESEDATFGIRTLKDLSWKDLLDGFTCTECGRCQEACPAYNTGKPLNPKAFVMGLRDMAESAEVTIDLIPNSPAVITTYGLPAAVPAATAMAAPIIDTAIPYDAVWDCVTCGACVEACPVLIEHVDKIVGLRRNLVLEDSKFPPELNAAFRGMESVSNPWGQPPATRTDWTKGLPFEVPTVADRAAAGTLDRLEVLYWVGCAAAFDDRNRKVARAFATCLDAAGVDFAILGQEEACTGDPARRMGNDYVYQMLAQGNIDTLNRYRMGERTIVTACPHCFNSIGNEYSQMGGSFRVVHHSVFLRELIASGRLRVLDDAPARTVTLHDSCYLARYNGVIDAPRDVLGAVAGVELVELEKRGRQTFCCGAGGGRMWMEETRGTRINASRTAQVLASGADTLATECPFCMTMLKDGLEEADNPRGVRAVDIAELLAESVVPGERQGRALPVLQ